MSRPFCVPPVNQPITNGKPIHNHWLTKTKPNVNVNANVNVNINVNINVNVNVNVNVSREKFAVLQPTLNNDAVP